VTEEARLPALRPEDLSAEQRRLYDTLTTGPRGAAAGGIEVAADGALAGPFNALLRHPAVGDSLQALGASLRYSGVLTDRCRELAVLLVAAHHRSRYEWHAHAPLARRAGLSDAQLEDVRTGRTPDVEDAAERTVVATVRALLARGDLDDAAYRRAAGTLGDAALVELTALVGYYALLALQLRVFRVPLPVGAAEVALATRERLWGATSSDDCVLDGGVGLTESVGESAVDRCFPPDVGPP
jgi:4-carboxymuconolactone decarboxylase